jgi:ribosomal protein RSM22 (predicted rRNA methylase)
MKRIPLQIPDEYIAALSERMQFDLSPANIETRIGKAYIAKKAGIVSQISTGLTSNRTEFLARDYLKSKEIRESYLLYYMTTNLLKIIPPLRELALSGFFEKDSLRVLDLGTGTGAAAWGLMTYLRNENKEANLNLVLTDSVKENLIEADNFSRNYIPHLSKIPKISFEQYNLEDLHNIPGAVKEKAPYSLITMMNVLNELPEENDKALLDMMLSLLEYQGAIIMIEPATRIESRRLLRFRDLAVKESVTIYAPCTRQDGCPALIDEDNWCHSEVAWDRPAFIKAIDEITGMLRLSLKYSYVILRKDGMILSKALQKNNLYRVVSQRFDEKGRVRAYLCGEDGRNEHVINKRDVSESNRDFAEIERYDVVSLTGKEIREHDIKLPNGAEFSIVLPILGAR